MTETHSSIIPVPDPTDKTHQLVIHEIANLREMLLSRLDSMDKAMDVFSENITRVPTQLDKEIGGLRSLVWERIDVITHRFDTVNQQFATMDAKFTEKFIGIGVQFHERDTRVDQTARASKEALDAALQAAKEAVGKQNDSFVTSIAKSEAATAKQIDQLVLLQNATAAAIGDKIDDIKNRLTATESAVLARHDVKLDSRASGSSLVSGISVAAAVFFGLVSLVLTTYHLFHVGTP